MTEVVQFLVEYVPEDLNYAVVSGTEAGKEVFRTSRRNLERFLKDMRQSGKDTIVSLKDGDNKPRIRFKGRNTQTNRVIEYLELQLEQGD